MFAADQDWAVIAHGAFLIQTQAKSYYPIW